MMKKVIAAAALSLSLTAIFAGCGSKDIGQAAAKEAAFNDAGVQESDATRLKVSKDRDDGKTIYEIDFDINEKEYSYDIDASNGDILKSDVEIDESYQSQQAASAQTTPQSDAQTTADASAANTGAQTAPDPNAAASSTPAAAVSMEDAKNTALAKVPGATDQNIKIELDYDDGKTYYEGDIIYDHMEYDFKIDASTGAIVEWSEEVW